MAQKAEQLDAVIEVVTPENIGFEYRIAGPFRRGVALLIDWSLLAAVLFGFGIVLSMTIGVASSGMATFLFLVAFHFLYWFYGGFCETWMNGQTLGKRVLGLRVLTVDGQPIDAMQAVMRNLLRSADILLFFQAGVVMPIVGMVVSGTNRRYQRLGDLVCGTIVVIEDRQWLTGVARLEDPRAIQLAGFLPPDFVVSRSLAKALSTYVERRRFFTPLRRREVARHLAQPLLERFGLAPDTSYDLLLCALYYRTFIADRGDDEKRLAEAAVNPFAAPATAPALNPFLVAPASVPLPQERMAGIPTFGQK